MDLTSSCIHSDILPFIDKTIHLVDTAELLYFISLKGDLKFSVDQLSSMMDVIAFDKSAKYKKRNKILLKVIYVYLSESIEKEEMIMIWS